MNQNSVVVLLVLAFFCSAALACESSYAWVRSSGEVVTSGGGRTLNVTKIAPGQYCLQTVEDDGTIGKIGTYAPVLVTIQDKGQNTYAGATANTGTGNSCNPYGGTMVRTFRSDDSGSITTDYDFSVAVWDC
eukprot:CAMPEP_0177649190 /NCGR_PEP_ID=MMETSP0447-20121125/11237_1 /TAXON_ID=0 /ORGANISM="Stygamoeba regulata, Strain BSH-02190019" /LENGTH=131 /DNA_ID=CAMNT_0019151897 /DNA_START=98 /DNA_END=493 /DNA_ORIENTATION=-